jgi:HK97 family phage prohead protease
MAETYRVPQGVQDEAKKALSWIADGHAGSGFTAVGRKRASDLAAGHAVSADTILRMYSFFKRHEADKQATGFNAGEEGFPTPGRVAWSAWGGDAGFTWSTRIRNQISKSARALSLMASEEGDMADMNQVPDLNEELTELLADVVSFYFRAHGAHWNVKGSDFSEYHKLFNEIYEDVYGSIDPIAENLRKLGSLAPFTLPSFIALRSIDDAPAMLQDPMSLASDLIAANDIIIDEISDAFDCATMYGQQGVANFLADRLDKHQFWKWQLTASIGQEVMQTSPDPVNDQGVDEDDVEDSLNPTGDQVDDMLAEQGLAPMPISGRSASGATDLPLADREYKWDAAAADKRVQDYAGGSDNMDWAKYGKAFFYVDSENKELLGSYKLGFADVIDGELKAVPRGIFAVAAVLQGGRGGVDIPEADQNAIKNKVASYYVKMAKEFDDESIKAPFEGRSEEVTMEARKAAIASADRITMSAEVRAVDTTDGSLRIAGYAATFNKEADGLNFREVIAPGAFTRALDTQDPVFLLVNHDMEGIPLASTQSGTLQLRQDANGLFIEAELDPANPRAQELTSALRRGDMDKMSFAFTVQPDGQTRDAGLRTITEIDRLFEVSVVTLPAYSSTSVGMRSQADTDLDLAKRKLKIKVKQHSLRNRKG